MVSEPELTLHQQDCYFEEINEALMLSPNFAAVYSRYISVFHRLIAEHTRFSSIQFGGDYARTAHLLKEHGASPKFAWQVHDMRVRLFKFADTHDKSAVESTVADNYLYDFETLCRFVALIYDCSIPAGLIDLFPEARIIQSPLRAPRDTDYIRIVVEKADDEYIYGHSDSLGQNLKVAFARKRQSDDLSDFSYLKSSLAEGTILGVVRPVIDDGVIYADFIIFEPDYLVNVSEVANCFRPYAVTHYQQLIDRLKPEARTEAILLGNFTGQLLDEEINCQETPVSYRKSVERFFKSHAFNIVSTSLQSDFHDKAKRQKENIRRTFAELTKVVKSYDRSKAILEPTFLSPMLGLQGRVDLMLIDHSFLVEQKSGNSQFPCPTFPEQRPRPQEAHYVQMLLYMMIMRYNYPKIYAENKGISSFLLYSKYPVSLCGLGWAPRIEFEAVRIRNYIAIANYEYAKSGVGVLDMMTPESMRKRKVNDKLWSNYSLPEISNVLDPVHNASSLERKYFYRMMRFVGLEHLLSKVGCNGTDRHGMASIWLNPLDIKLANGDIYMSMRLVSPDKKCQGIVEDVVLSFDPDADNSMANFRKGDIVVLYPYPKHSTPDACRTMILRCVVSEITADQIVLRLNAPQSSTRFFTSHSDSSWAIEHDFMESAYAPLYRGLHAMLTTDKDRRDLLLLQREPVIDPSLSINGDYGSFNRLAVRVKQACDFFLIIGPPGTGKTSFGMLNTLKEQLTDQDATVMVTAYTNRAVDEICSKLVDEGIDFLRIGSRMSAEQRYQRYLLENKVEECRNLNDLRDVIGKSRVIVGTTAAFCRNIVIFSMKVFSLAIIDEASQILEPQILPILTAMHGREIAVKKFVMIGDHKQLPAVVQQRKEESAVDDAELNEIGLYDCGLSLFERLLKRYGHSPSVAFMLNRQGRMHRDIAEFVNSAFYYGKLDVVPLKHQIAELPVNGLPKSTIASIPLSHRIAFIAVKASGLPESISDKVNTQEADIIAAIVAEVYKIRKQSFSVTDTIGVIVPYRNQIVAVRKAIEKYRISQLSDITIDTVERYQGSQRDVIVYGFTVRRRYQLDFLTSTSFEENGAIIDRKLNVAMTRAKEHLILVGNPDVLSFDSTHKKLIDYIKEKGGFFMAPL